MEVFLCKKFHTRRESIYYLLVFIMNSSNKLFSKFPIDSDFNYNRHAVKQNSLSYKAFHDKSYPSTIIKETSEVMRFSVNNQAHVKVCWSC